MSANTPNPQPHNDAGVPRTPRGPPKAGFAQRSNRLRLIAAHWLGCTADASICVLHRWTRPDDDARAVRLETNVDGCVRRITLFRLSSGAWSPVWQ
jgi:hypothetical protein